ncbi:hypothetical protein NBRC110019_15870 [Neptunitalea chrysea]|uniref:Tetratricopeptide repeat-containing protein n=1 Tax=Neptunitalea chrysea TaxID=1647581 RepID=A0A9W6B646_9FLAO|nr:hypothetical protein [Neptunitalea chrysea]GLB52547.1 hypothetical protein NBRC110019_15870 [Neptunitalea chrysea]
MKVIVRLWVLVTLGVLVSCNTTTSSEQKHAATDTIPLPEEVTAKKIVPQRTAIQEKISDSLYLVATNARMIGNTAKAIAICEQIVAADAYYTSANKLLVNLYTNSGKFNEALSANKKVLLTGDPTFGDYVHSGLLLEVMNKPAKAASYYKQAQRLLKEKEGAYWKRVDTLGMISMFIEVRDTIRGNELIETMIANKGMDETQKKAFINFGKKSHIDKINRLKALLKKNE